MAKRQTAFSDLLFLHRDNPIMRPLYEWRPWDRWRLSRRHLMIMTC
jgi:hypothetical protein